MGQTKETTVVDNTSTQSYEPTAAEKEYQQLLLNAYKQTQQPQTDLQLQSMGLASNLLAGGQLPGYLSGLTQGITGMDKLGTVPTIDASQYQIGEDTTQQLVKQGLRDLYPQLQGVGILDSGVTAELGGKLATDIRTQVAQSNLERALGINEYNLSNQLAANQFDINTGYSQQAFNQNQLLNLLNLAVGGQAQVQSPVLAQTGILGNAIAGQGTTTGTTQGTYTSYQNPFLQSFYSNMGEGFGKFVGSVPSATASAFGGGWGSYYTP